MTLLRSVFAIVLLLCLTTAVSLCAVRPGTAAQTSTKKISISFEPVQLPPATAGTNHTVSVILNYEAPIDLPSRVVTIKLNPPMGISVKPVSQDVVIYPGKSTPVTFTVTDNSDNLPQTRITATVDTGDTAILKTGLCYDLSAVSFRSMIDKDNIAESKGWVHTDFTDSSWPQSYLPIKWESTKTAYIRTYLHVPESWRGKDLSLYMKSVDDADICYLNGNEIGKTSGANTPRNYKIDPAVVRYGEDNLLCIVVKNLKGDSGIPKEGNYFGIDIPE